MSVALGVQGSGQQVGGTGPDLNPILDIVVALNCPSTSCRR